MLPSIPTDGTGSRNYLWSPGTFSNDINISKTIPMFNSPDQLVANLVGRSPNATTAEKFNQYRSGVGHYSLTSVMDMRRIEMGVRLKF
jgi:hypothetical protein